MWLSTFLPFLGLAGSSLAISCAPVHLIVARGSFEPQGEGITASLSTAIKKALPGTTSEALVYPAVIPYLGSLSKGTANLKDLIAKYTEACPSSKLVLIGYSQGGAVVMDALCGGGGKDIGVHTDGITEEQGRLIKLALSFGEPRFIPGMSYGLGTNNKTTGLFARDPKEAQCPKFTSVIRSWCDAGDARCAQGDSMAVHVGYIRKYGDIALKYVLDAVKT